MKKILVIEDDIQLQQIYKNKLEGENFEILQAFSGDEGLDIAKSKKPDLIILDIMLPDVDGYTICRKIREQFVYPIIMLTAKVEDMYKIMGLTMGADDSITKPFNPLEVVARVNEA